VHAVLPGVRPILIGSKAVRESKKSFTKIEVLLQQNVIFFIELHQAF
jgi:hypothetical protein